MHKAHFLMIEYISSFKVTGKIAFDRHFTIPAFQILHGIGIIMSYG